MESLSSFKTYTTDNNIDLHICDNSKFKTNLIELYLVQPLKNKILTTKTALIPFVLYRGSRKYPTNKEITIKLDELYGANLNISVIKRGENQLIKFSLELVNEKFIPEKINLFDQALELLYQLVFNPLLENNSFLKDYLKQGKDYIEDQIKGLINDKYRYAIERCYQEMCKDETYGLYKLGVVSKLEEINGAALCEHYQQVVKNSPLSIFVVGDLREEQIYKKINLKFRFKHEKSYDYNNTDQKSEVEGINEVLEESNIRQGKLSLGFRTGITRQCSDYYSLMIYNGILGGFPHSKLFQNVREKASLAYYANSKLESTKGLLLITSGIQVTNYEKVKELIVEQLNLLKQGKITEQEIDWTKKGLINKLKSTSDNNKGLVGHYLLGLINDIPETIDTMIKKLENVDKEEIIEVAKKIQLDTIYFLKDKEAEE